MLMKFLHDAYKFIVKIIQFPLVLLFEMAIKLQVTSAARVLSKYCKFTHHLAFQYVMDAIETKNISQLSWLIEAEVYQNSDLAHAHTANQLSPLEHVAITCDHDILEMLIKTTLPGGIKPDDYPNILNLVIGCRNQSTTDIILTLEMLICAGLFKNKNRQDDYGKTPIEAALERENEQILTYLIYLAKATEPRQINFKFSNFNHNPKCFTVLAANNFQINIQEITQLPTIIRNSNTSKAKIKITVHGESENFLLVKNSVSFDLSYGDTWHGLKELERKGVFAEIYRHKNIINILQKYEYEYDTKQLSGHFFRVPPEVVLLNLKPAIPKITTMHFTVLNANTKIADLIKIFTNCGFAVDVVGAYPVKLDPYTPNLTIRDYAIKVEDAENMYDKCVSRMHERYAIGSRNNLPNIETYLHHFNEKQSDGFDRYIEERNFGKPIKQRLYKKSNQETQGWQMILQGEDAIKEAIVEAIHRIEITDNEGNTELCPITLEPFTDDDQVILILSIHDEDDILQANFVRNNMNANQETDTLSYLQRTLKKNPVSNNPIIALETGALVELKEKYRATRSMDKVKYRYNILS